MVEKRYIHSIQILLFAAILFLSGCASSQGLPVKDSQKGVSYYFPRTGVSLTRSFDAEMIDDRNSTDAYYRQRAVTLLKQSGYFLDISEHKRPYMIRIKYHHYVYTPMTEELLSLFSPINALFGPTLEMGLDLDMEVLDHRKIIARYHYQKRFEAKRDEVKKIAETFFDDSMKTFLDALAHQSGLKPIAVKSDIEKK